MWCRTLSGECAWTGPWAGGIRKSQCDCCVGRPQAWRESIEKLGLLALLLSVDLRYGVAAVLFLLRPMAFFLEKMFVPLELIFLVRLRETGTAMSFMMETLELVAVKGLMGVVIVLLRRVLLVELAKMLPKTGFQYRRWLQWPFGPTAGSGGGVDPS